MNSITSSFKPEQPKKKPPCPMRVMAAGNAPLTTRARSDRLRGRTRVASAGPSGNFVLDMSIHQHPSIEPSLGASMNSSPEAASPLRGERASPAPPWTGAVGDRREHPNGEVTLECESCEQLALEHVRVPEQPSEPRVAMKVRCFSSRSSRRCRSAQEAAVR
jgi:hypothetical protein